MTKFAATDRMREMMMTYYLEAKNAAHNGRQVAWVTSGAPVEFLYAMDVIPIYPENHAAMCGTAHMALGLIEAAEARGYSPDLCSYARTDFGTLYTNGGPIAGLPKPDFLLCATNICKTVFKWYQVVARHYEVPLYLIDMPFAHRGVDAEIVEYVVNQLHALTGWLGGALGRPFVEDRFREVFRLAMEATALWQDVLHAARHKPSPINSFDTFIHLAPIVTLRGTPECVDYYRLLRDELRERIKNNQPSLPNERFRLLWDNLPIWDSIRYLSDLFGRAGAALVVATYTNSWAVMQQDIPPERLYHELARVYLQPYINMNFAYRVQYLLQMIKDYELDGFVMHSDRSCKPYSLGQYQIREEVQRLSGKPGLIIEADQNDPRVFAKAQIETRVEAFLEQLAAA